MSIGTVTGGYLENGLMLRTTTYQQMYRRPYQANFGQNVGMMREITAGMDFSEERLAPVAASSLLPVSEPECPIVIPGGFGNERCMFALKIVHQSNESGMMKLVQHLQGYTDYMGISSVPGIGGRLTIDPNMRLYFNSSLLLQELTTVNPYGIPTTTSTPVEASQLLLGNPASLHGQSSYTMRPQDLYSVMNSQEMMNAVNRYNVNNGAAVAPSAQVQDGRVMFQNGQPLKKSDRANLIPSNYLSKLLTNTQNVAMVHNDLTHQDLANKISGSLGEQYISSDHTLGEVLKRTGLSENGSITYGELCQFFQNADQMIYRAGMEQQKVRGAYGADSEYFHGTSWELLIAQMLQNVVSSLLVSNSLRAIALRGDNFTGTNMTTGVSAGQFIVNALDARSFVVGRPTEQACEVIKHRLNTEFLAGYTGHNYIPLAFNINIDLYGECVIHISYNHQPMTRFVTPMFGDSLLSPVLTNERSYLANLTQETRAMTHNLLNVL